MKWNADAHQVNYILEKFLMNQSYSILRYLSVFWVLVLSAFTAVAQKMPNFVVILMDDMGYDDLSFHGHKYLETPQLDKLASQSVRFNDFTVCSVCSPTRASLLTGRHFLQTGVDGVHGGREFINIDEKILPEFFKAAGYVTGMFGKWHNGKTDGYFPWDRGFDVAYMANLYQYFPSSGLLNGIFVSEQRWAEEVITDYAIGFIDDNKDNPFFLYVPYMTPHGLWNAPEENVNKYLDKDLSLPFATVCGMMDFIDGQIGRLLVRLDDLGLSDNTIVVFLSDNGPQSHDRNLGELTAEEWEARNPSGYPGWKGTNWVNGVKSPLFFRYPGKWEPGTVSRLVDISDLLPTFIDLAGIDSSGVKKPFTGRSIKPYLEGNLNDLTEKTVFMSRWFAGFGERSPIAQYMPVSDDVRRAIRFEDQSLVIRDEHFKLILNYNPRVRPELAGENYLLFDLKNDPFETTNVAGIYPERKQSMLNELELWYESIIKDENSMTAPWFQIGWKEKNISVFPAYGPSRVYGNVTNNSHFINNWRSLGDRADYQIEVNVPGSYRVEMILGDCQPEGIVMKLGYKEQNIIKPLTNSVSQTFEILHLEEGRAVLSLELVASDVGSFINQIREFRFILVNKYK
jgi:arylsulfatase A-like enzyme